MTLVACLLACNTGSAQDRDGERAHGRGKRALRTCVGQQCAGLRSGELWVVALWPRRSQCVMQLGYLDMYSVDLAHPQ